MTMEFYRKNVHCGGGPHDGEPGVTITPHGFVRITGPICIASPVPEFPYALVGWDREAKVFAVKPLAAWEIGASKVHGERSGKARIFGCRAILRHFGLTHWKTKSYPATWVDGEIRVHIPAIEQVPETDSPAPVAVEAP